MPAIRRNRRAITRPRLAGKYFAYTGGQIMLINRRRAIFPRSVKKFALSGQPRWRGHHALIRSYHRRIGPVKISHSYLAWTARPHPERDLSAENSRLARNR